MELKYNITLLTGSAYSQIETPGVDIITDYNIFDRFEFDKHFIEYSVFDNGERIISDLKYKNKIKLDYNDVQGIAGASAININVERDIKAYDVFLGEYVVSYRVLYNPFSLDINQEFYISEISPDRTELYLKSFNYIQEQIDTGTEILEDELINKPYFDEFRVRFSRKNLDVIGINFSRYEEGIVVKLLEPLTEDAIPTDTVHVLLEISDPTTYNVDISIIPDDEIITKLRGPNYNIYESDQNIQNTQYLSYDDLITLPLTSSNSEIYSYINRKGVDLNIDYSDYSEFVHFSSAEERLRNFKYKVDLIQNYQYQIDTLKSGTGPVIASSSIDVLNSRISNIVNNFDGYERHLYYESNSISWPKSTTSKPHELLTGSNAAVTSWYNEYITSASNYDNLNDHSLRNGIPLYVLEDDQNDQFTLFVDMIGQHFDVLWTYAQSVTERHNTDNRYDVGPPKELLGDILRSFGIKLYTSNLSIDSLTTSIIGEWFPTGSDMINTFVTASNTPVSTIQQQQEVYKRIYHNLPYLVKTRGTTRGLKALLACFGVPMSIIDIKEFGGVITGSFNFGTDTSTIDKIRLSNTGSIVTGSTLSYYTSIQNISDLRNQDRHTLEVGFSPTNEVNEEISASLPNFNIDEYIGDPRQKENRSYPDLVPIQNDTFFSHSMYDVQDYIRLIRYFDNALFKMVYDFIPARVSATSGIIIKPNYLNRSKVQRFEPDASRVDLTASIDTAFFSGSDGGVFGDQTTNWVELIPTVSGSYYHTHSYFEERYNGEFGGSVLTVTTQSLNIANTYKKENIPEIYYDVLTIDDGGAVFVDNEIDDGVLEVEWKTFKVEDIELGYPATQSAYVAKRITVSRYSDNTPRIDMQPTWYAVDSVLINHPNKMDTYYVVSSNKAYDSVTIPGPSTVQKEVFRLELDQSPYNNFLASGVQYAIAPDGKEVILGGDQSYLTFTTGSEGDDLLVVPQPYIPANALGAGSIGILFSNSPYNALFGNYSTNRQNDLYQIIDYDNGSALPSNLLAIRAGVGSPAQVQMSNYSTAKHGNIRYYGSKLSAQVNGKFTPGDKSYGGNPAISTGVAYFGIIDWSGNQEAELLNHSSLHLKYLVDENGDAYALQNTPDILGIIQYGFSKGSNIDISFFNATTIDHARLSGLKTVREGGKKIENILFTESGSNGSIVGAASITLRPAGTTATTQDFTTYASSSDDQLIDGYGYTVVFDEAPAGLQGAESAGALNTGTGVYTFQSSPLEDLQFGARLRITGSKEVSTQSPGRLKANIVKFNDAKQTTNIIGTTTTRVFDPGEVYDEILVVTSSLTKFRENDQVYVEIAEQPYPDPYIISESTFRTIAGNLTAQTISSEYFTTGSNSPNILTGSAEITDVYGKYSSNPWSGSIGFSETRLPFTVQFRDEIRFERRESERYIVVDVSEPVDNTDDTLYITLDRPVSTGLDINFFSIIRFVDDSSRIIFRVLDGGSAEGLGLVVPEIMSEKLKKNFSAILQQLNTKNII